MIKNLLLALLLLSPTSFADWGDIYYCQMTHMSVISRTGEQESYKEQTFKFQVSKDEHALIFGKGGYFGEVTAQLSSYFLKREVLGKSLLASDDWSNYFMDEGKFSYTRVGPDEVFAITADCDKF